VSDLLREGPASCSFSATFYLFECLEDLGDSPYSPPSPAAAPEATNPFSRRFFGAIEDDRNELLPLYSSCRYGERSCVRAYIGPDLGVVLEQEDFEEVMDVGAEDEFIGEEDEGRTRFTAFRVCLGFASPEFSETPLLTIRP
jgi:hypothetical protein